MSGTNSNEMKAEAARHLAINDLPAAMDLYARACQLDPTDVNTRLILANMYRQAGNIVKAIDMLSQASMLQPENVATLRVLAELQLGEGLLQPCINSCNRLLSLANDDATAYSLLGTALQSQGNLVEACQSHERAVQLAPNNAVYYYKYACALQTLGEFEKALYFFRQARHRAPEFTAALGGLVRIHAQMDNADELGKLVDPLLQAGKRDPLVLPTLASIAPRFHLTEQVIQLVEQHLSASRLPVNLQARLHWALGTLYESTHEYDNAFTSHARSKSLAVPGYNSAAHTNFVNRIINVYSREFLAAAPRASCISQVPLFIVGMPRSGTSLVEQILSSHPKVHGAGELPHITWIANSLSKMTPSGKSYPECTRELTQEHMNVCATRYLGMLTQLGHDALRITDKMPHNFRHLGLIELLFPGARVIHVARDPLDTCLSCYFQEFSAAHAYTRTLRDLGTHYHDYERLMLHWRRTLGIPMLTLQYEDVVANLEKFSRQLIEFCGLEWNDACLDFHRQDRVVQTLSSEQVRRPIYTSSVGRWKNYQSHLGELQEALGIPSS